MRILHLTDRVSDRGGAHWHLIGVLEALRAAGHDVHLAAGKDDGRLAPPCPVTIVPGLEARTCAPVTLDRLWRRLAPDLVHLHTVVNPAVLEWAAGRPAVITVQDHRYFCPGRGKRTADGEVCRQPMRRDLCAGCFTDESYFADVHELTRLRFEALKRLSAVVLSRYMAGELVAAGLEPDRITVVPPFAHGLDPDANADGPPCVLFAGRFTESKGVADAIAAWRRSGLCLPLVAAGAGPLRPLLEKAGAELLGWLDRRRLSAAYRRARALVMPSRWQEPFGIVGLEALSMGVPVVAWESGGVAEWHPGPGLARWGDVEGLARALREVAGERVAVPAGFERDRLMARLLRVYRHAASPPPRAWATMRCLELPG